MTSTDVRAKLRGPTDLWVNAVLDIPAALRALPADVRSTQAAQQRD